MMKLFKRKKEGSPGNSRKFGDEHSNELDPCPRCGKCRSFWNLDFYDNSLFVCCNPECRALVQRSPISGTLQLIMNDATEKYHEIRGWWDAHENS